MNWIIDIIICQLLFVQASELSESLKCGDIKRGNCDLTNCKIDENIFVNIQCQYFSAKVSKPNRDTNMVNNMVIYHMVEIGCDLKRSSVNVIDLQHNGIQIWEKSFNQINVSSLNYNYCPIIGTGINQSISILGILNGIQNIKFQFSTFGSDNELKSFFLENLSTLEILEITNSDKKLILTNESFKGIPNVKKIFLYRNNIEEIPHGIFKDLIHLKTLDLSGNHITTIDSVILDRIPLKELYLNTNYIEKLNLNQPSLVILKLNNNKKLTSINVKNLKNLKNISLIDNINLTSMPDRPFKNTSLVKFEFTNVNNFTVPNEFLSNLNGLVKVILTGLNIEMVPENMILNSPNIITMSLSSNRLIEIPQHFFKNSNKIKSLDLSGNKIEVINHELLKPLISLEELNLSKNLIHAIYSKCFDHLTNLTKLDLSRNKITNIEVLNVLNLNKLILADNNISSLLYSNESGGGILFFKNLKNLEELDLSDNSISSNNNGDWTTLIRLKKINLKNNNFTNVNLIDWYLGIEIDITSNPIQFINVSRIIEIIDYEKSIVKKNGFKATNLSLSSDKFICDGRNYEFGKFLKNTSQEKFLFKIYDLTCNGTKYLKFNEQNLDTLTYDWNLYNGSKKGNCSKCVCSYRPSDNSAIMDCSNRNITQIPEPKYIISSDDINYIELNLKNNLITDWPDYSEPNITKLDLSHNMLASINVLKLPKNITNLHLDHNNLTTIISGTNLSNVLTKLQCLTLSYNILECPCNNMSMFHFFRNFSSQIIDKQNVTCYNSKNPSINFSISTLPDDVDVWCESMRSDFKIYITLILILSTVVLTVIVIVLICIFRDDIVYGTYKHFPLLFPDEYDSIEYDAFVSYAHGDQEFIEQQLKPELENGHIPFKLCLHNRDWLIGRWIPDQIIDSVNKSYKTIIVLSKNFLRSYWGLVEFRIAFLKRLKERKNNLIIIIHGDLSIIDDLGETMKNYVKMHTYIKSDDPKIWKRLRKVLSHRRIKEIEITNENTVL